MNGVISFREPFSSPTPQYFPLPRYRLIAPFWDNIDISNRGQVYYRFTDSPALCDEVVNYLENMSDIIPFKPTLLFIATWEGVPLSGVNQGGKVNNLLNVTST